MQKITKINNLIHNYLKNLLSRSSPFDGRYLVLFSLVAYFSTLFIANFFIPYRRFWRNLGIPAADFSFMDTRLVLSGFECTRLGYDVLLENPCAHTKFSIIYPRIWWKFTWLGLDQSHTVFIGFILAITFFLVTLYMLGKINIYEGITYSLILCSPPIMFLIERGNADLIVYFCIFISLYMIQRKVFNLRLLGYFGLIVPILLKIFPLFSLTVILKEKKNVFTLVF